MPASSDLHQLIHSMSKSEKRFFKLQSADTETNYHALFDLLNGMDIYDESKVQQVVEKAGWTKHLSWTKGHLMEQLLRSLRNYHSARELDLQIADALFYARLFFARGIEKNCRKMLRKAKKLAKEHQKYPQLLEIIEFERSVMIKAQERGYAAEVHASIAEKDAIIDHIRLHFDLLDAQQSLFIIARRAERAWEGLREEAALAVLARDFPAEGNFRPKLSQHFGHAINFQINGQYQEAFAEYESILTLFETHPAMRKAEQRLYILMLNNYLNLAHAVDAYDRFPPMLAKLEALKPGNLDEEAEIFQNSRFLRLLYIMNTGAFEENTALIREVESGLRRYGNRINAARQLSFLFTIAFIAFMTDDFDTAWKWNQKIIDGDWAESRQDVQGFARLFALLIGWEQGELRWLESAVAAAYQRLRRGGARYPFEKVIVTQLRRLMAALPDEQNAVLQGWLAELEALRTPSGTDIVFGQAECMLWLRARIAGKPMPALLKTMR